VPARAAGMPLPRPAGIVSAENLIVPVPGTGTPVLKGVGFSLAAGEALAVIGPSGSGKTSLARALVGLWPSVGGKVRLDGADVCGWDKAELGPHLGYLPQGVELLDGTIAQNIARFTDGDPGAVEAAARQVGLHDWIVSLPRGYETPVGPEGLGLSGGQRQRLGLARALYGGPAFVVLDEPNASLDTEGDAALVSAIGQAKAAGTSFVVITHRTGVLALCEKVLVLADGQTQVLGSRNEVLAALEPAARSVAPQPPAARREPLPHVQETR
jgi:ATP-binding cassette, subfamily C, bacterial exporter for protease/lipase